MCLAGEMETVNLHSRYLEVAEEARRWIAIAGDGCDIIEGFQHVLSKAHVMHGSYNLSVFNLKDTIARQSRQDTLPRVDGVDVMEASHQQAGVRMPDDLVQRLLSWCDHQMQGHTADSGPAYRMTSRLNAGFLALDKS